VTTMAESFAILATPAAEKDLPLIRELLAYDVQCEASCVLKRDGDNGCYLMLHPPSVLHWSRQSEWPWAVRAAELEPDHDVLDVGAGWGALPYAFAKRCRTVTILDPNAEAMVKAAKTARALGFGNVHHHVGDGRAIPFPDNAFDRVVCVSVLEHVEEGRKAMLDELTRVLKPGGRLLLTLDFVWDGVSKDDFFVTVDEVGGILEYFDLRAAAEDSRTTRSAHIGDGVYLSVLMICWVKPEVEKT
jgi:SAM-dependent methyltransferase